MGSPKTGDIRPEAEQGVLDQLRARFRPEFLNRVDDIILFKPLNHNEIREIVGLFVEELIKRIGDRGLHLEVAEEVLDHIARAGYDATLGARPLKRYVQREVETPIARALIQQSPVDGSTVLVGLSKDQFEISIRAADATRRPEAA